MVDFKKALEKVKGKFDKVLAFDCETSGVNFDGIDPSINYKMLSAGLIIADADFKPIEELYVEFKWADSDKHYKWSEQAFSIHGLSKEHLDKHGVTENDGAEAIGGILYEHFGMDNAITLLGTNVASFDQFFLKRFLNNMGIPFKFSHRMLDTFSLGYGTLGAYTSDELFDILGFAKRTNHNALEDARMSLNSFKVINDLWNTQIG